MRSVKFPRVEVGGVFEKYELDKVQPLTRSITEMDALSLSCWLSKFVQEVVVQTLISNDLSLLLFNLKCFSWPFLIEN